MMQPRKYIKSVSDCNKLQNRYSSTKFKFSHNIAVVHKKFIVLFTLLRCRIITCSVFTGRRLCISVTQGPKTRRLSGIIYGDTSKN